MNNWKENQLLIRYARNSEELCMIEEAIKQDRALPPEHDERSLLYDIVE